MPSVTSVVRVLAWLAVIALLGATAMYLVLALNLWAQPPTLPPTTDFVDSLLADGDYQRQVWPFDLASSLLYVVALLAGALIARPLVALGRDRNPWGWLAATGLILAGVFGIVAQVIYIGARQVAISIPYCDCQYKVPEVLAQSWGMWLIQGSVDWLTNVMGAALAIGVASAGMHLGRDVMPAGWRYLSWLIAIGLVFAVVAAILGLPDPVGPVLIGVSTGILLPIWFAWIAVRATGVQPPVQVADDGSA